MKLSKYIKKRLLINKYNHNDTDDAHLLNLIKEDSRFYEFKKRIIECEKRFVERLKKLN